MKNNSFIKGIFLLTISQVLIKFFGIIYSLYLTNKTGFGDEGNAIYMGGYQVYALLLTLSSIGIPNAIAKIIAEKKALGDYLNIDRIIKISMIIFGSIGFIGGLFLIIFSSFISNYILVIPECKTSLIFLAPAIFFVSISSVFKGYFNANEHIDITAFNQFFEQVIKCVLTITFVELSSKITNENTYFMASMANLATSFATFFSFFLIYRKYIKFTEKIIFKKSTYNVERISEIIFRILSISIPVSLTIIINSLGKNIDAITVVRLLKDRIGEKESMLQYGILASKVDIFTNLPLAFNTSIITSLIPEISRDKIIGFNDNSLLEKIKVSVILSLIISVPYSMAVFVYSNEIFNLLFPNANNGSELLKFSSYNIVFALLVQTFTGILQGIGNDKVPLKSSIVCIILKFLVNIILIKVSFIQIKGALIGNLISNIAGFIIMISYIKRNIGKSIFDFRKILSIFLISISMIFISKICYKFLLKIMKFNISFVIMCTISMIFYAFFIKFLKIFSKKVEP